MAGESPDWVRDVVVTELRRSYPDAVDKNELQEHVGVGPGDLRTALEDLAAAGEIRPEEDGYAWVEVEDRVGVLTERATEPDPSEEGEDAAAPEEERLRGDVPLGTSAGTQYRARIVLDVTYVPDELVTDDEAAVAEADQLRVAAMNGILAEWPDLAISGAVIAVDAFDNPRRVYGGRGAVDEG